MEPDHGFADGHDPPHQTALPHGDTLTNSDEETIFQEHAGGYVPAGDIFPFNPSDVLPELSDFAFSDLCPPTLDPSASSVDWALPGILDQSSNDLGVELPVGFPPNAGTGDIDMSTVPSVGFDENVGHIFPALLEDGSFRDDSIGGLDMNISTAPGLVFDVNDGDTFPGLLGDGSIQCDPMEGLPVPAQTTSSENPQSDSMKYVRCFLLPCFLFLLSTPPPPPRPQAQFPRPFIYEGTGVAVVHM